MKTPLLCAAALALTACTTTPRYKPLCPPLVQYTPQEQEQAADELRAHPDLHELPIMMRDYGNIRGEIKVSCFGDQAP